MVRVLLTGRLRRLALSAASLLSIGLASDASAAPITLSDVQFWAGSGTNQAGFVIDWNDGKSNESLAWGYRWNGTATGADAFDAIVAADPRLFAHVGVPGSFGVPTYGFGYDTNNSGNYATTPALTFGTGGVAVSGSAPANDNRAAVDAADHFRDGWNAGFWSYFNGTGTTPTWAEAQTGAADRVLVNGGWDGWAYASSYPGPVPGDAVAAVPEPAAGATVLAAGALLAARRRRRRARTAAGLAAVVTVSAAGVARADYVYDANDFAVAVEASGTTGTFGASPYDSADSVLGRPTLKFNSSFNPNVPDYRRTKLFEAPFNTGPAGQKLITTVPQGSAITVRMGRPVTNDPNNPHGVDFIVFGNAFYGGSGDDIGEDTDLTAFTISGSILAERTKVSVSPDNVNWYRYENGPYADTAFPTNGYFWNRGTKAWTDVESDPTKPVDPSIAVAGKSAADVLDLYNGSAGGTGFDLAGTPYASIQYIRVEGLDGFAGGEIDAFADVRSVPEPAGVAMMTAAGLVGLATRRRRAM